MDLISRRAALIGAGATLAASLARAAPAPLRLRRGVNAFPWFQLTREYPAPRRDYASPPFQPSRPVPSPRDLAALRAAGFDFLRLPVDPGPLLAAGEAERNALIDQVLGAVALCLKADLSVVVNLQANAATHYWTPARMTASTEAPEFPAYLALVEAIAARLPARAALEPINEPIGGCASAQTRAVREALLARARKAAPDLTLIASGGCGGLIQGLADFDPASVARFAPLLYTFHFYEPYLFTHQGAPWMGERLYHTLTGVPWPGAAGSYEQTMRETRARIDALPEAQRAGVLAETEKVMQVYFDANPARPFIDGYLGAAAQWAKRNGVPTHQVLLGEFGALRKDARYAGARAPDRARYVKDVRESAESFGFPWAFWCLFDGMGLMDERERTLDPAILGALGLSAR
ncbi:MAG: cellulase family glycosylhydrolase [Pseudomonadota bacterium]|nr:cellulase family glycosylhydrolase [Pseudomonadota bacterium]